MPKHICSAVLLSLLTSCVVVEREVEPEPTFEPEALPEDPSDGLPSLRLKPVADADLEDSGGDGVFDLVRAEDNGTVIIRRIPGYDEFRIALEFDISELHTLPVEATFVSAALRIFSDGGSLPGVSIVPHGYAGNGSIELADAEVDNPIGDELVPITSPRSKIDVTDLVAELLAAKENYAGILFRAVNNSDLTAIHASESGALDRRPTLELVYRCESLSGVDARGQDCRALVKTQ
jgi:hypothetical protein